MTPEVGVLQISSMISTLIGCGVDDSHPMAREAGMLTSRRIAMGWHLHVAGCD